MRDMSLDHQTPDAGPLPFSERYGQLRLLRETVREERERLSEHSIQCLWYDQVFRTSGLKTVEGQRLKIVSPGWWNHGEGPDFRGAQIEFNGELVNGDVEIDLEPSGWRAHGHGLDGRYNNVILRILLDGTVEPGSVRTAEGRGVPTLVLRPYLIESQLDWAEQVDGDDEVEVPYSGPGRCAALAEAQGIEPLREFLLLAAEWRMLNKARALRERMDRAGLAQAVYEDLLYACGFSHFKQHFRALARALPYERARQLAQRDPMLLEAALLQLAGLLPTSLPEEATGMVHFARMRGLRNAELANLRALPLTWRRAGVRPINYPERRIAGVALLVARTARQGLVETMMDCWRVHEKPRAQREALEELFPRAMGFWSEHCTWTGKKLQKRSQPIGAGRIRSIIGNVFVPAALAIARHERDRELEECVQRFFSALPAEPSNHIIERMVPRVAPGAQLRLTFQLQQGLIQMHQDWCEPNPSCRNCALLRRLDLSWTR